MISSEIVDLKILQSDWLRAFWPISQKQDCSQYKICAETQPIIYIFIIEQVQWKLMTKVFFRFKKTYFGSKTFFPRKSCHVTHNFIRVSNTIRAYSRNSGQRSKLARKGTFLWKNGIFYEKSALFLKKKHPKKYPPPSPHPCHSIPLQSKALLNFCRRGHCLKVKCNTDLEYTLTMPKFRKI